MADNVIQRLVHELNCDHWETAARLFLQGQAQGVFPKNGNIPRWLIHKLGDKAAKRLISAFIHLPCFNCKGGVIPCEGCNGKGYTDTEMVCELCVGLGVTTCEFCAGTGWATIDYVPTGLQLFVLAGRMKVAQKRIEVICNQLLFVPKPEQAAAKFKEYAELLIRLNRHISIMESIYQDAKQADNSQQKCDDKQLKITHGCIHYATKGQKKLKEIIQTMALISNVKAQNTSDSSDTGKTMSACAELYRSLATSSDDFFGTFLEHPFLKEVIKKKQTDKITKGLAVKNNLGRNSKVFGRKKTLLAA